MKKIYVAQGSQPILIDEQTGNTIAVFYTNGGSNPITDEQAMENAKLCSKSPELLQMVNDLKSCIERLAKDDVSQFERDLEANWIGEANELITEIEK